ncbi:MAG: ion transporter [Limnospira sp.]
MLDKVKKRIFLILEVWTFNDAIGRICDYFIIALILLNVVAVCLETVEGLNQKYFGLFRVFEYFSIVVFTIEYILRVWACTIDVRYQHPFWGRLRYMLTPLALIDLLAFLPFYLPILTPDMRPARAVRLVKFFQFFKLTRYFQSLQMIGEVLKAKKEELAVTFGLVLLLLFFSGSSIYILEHDAQPEQFSSIPAAMWWGVVTLTTVGYGDVYPITTMGRLLGAMVAMLGIGIFALPAGIIASGFAEVVEARKNQKQAKKALICPHCGKIIERANGSSHE